jgi:hypothetical protein
MKITKLRLNKSKTVGTLGADGRSKFKKIQFEADAELNDMDDPKRSYIELSNFIDDCLNEEAKK